MIILNYSDTVTSDYVHHPINAFHLLKRTAKWMPNIKLKMRNLQFNYNLQLLAADYLRAHYGLAEIHEHYDLDTIEIANGEIKNARSGKIYKSNSPLDSSDLLQIANEAKKVDYLDGNVNWLNAALIKAVDENKNAKYISKLRYVISHTYFFFNTL